MKTEIFILSAIIWAATARAQITPEQAQRMRTEAETEYFDIRSVRSAYDDFRRNPDYDAERYAEKLRELESLCASDADADKERIIELKREILLSNPLLRPRSARRTTPGRISRRRRAAVSTPR